MRLLLLHRCISLLLGATPAGKHISVPQQAPLRTVQLNNILFKYPKPLVASNGVPPAVKDRMKQPLANDKQRCAVLISTNGQNSPSSLSSNLLVLL